MFRGFTLSERTIKETFKTTGFNLRKYPSLVRDFNDIYYEMSSDVDRDLIDLFVFVDNGVLNGSLIQDNWFPDVRQASVFISHSHKDLHLATLFAKWLYIRFGIISFIDSLIWNHSDKLQWYIDQGYCFDHGLKRFDYKKRNISTSHVHMMLTAALNKMIDKTECIIFLNTPNSNVGKGITNKTLSPWIYGEIETSRIIRKQIPKRIVLQMERTGYRPDVMEMITERKLDIEYSLNLDHLSEINTDNLSRWDEWGRTINEDRRVHINRSEKALDFLYNIMSNNNYEPRDFKSKD